MPLGFAERIANEPKAPPFLGAHDPHPAAQEARNHAYGTEEVGMSAKAKASGTTATLRTSASANTGGSTVGSSTPDEAMRRRAYEIYLERGGQPGHELDDWLQAERELSIHLVRVRERITDST
jgi:Protein of unknown function (DUF2934)